MVNIPLRYWRSKLPGGDGGGTGGRGVPRACNDRGFGCRGRGLERWRGAIRTRTRAVTPWASSCCLLPVTAFQVVVAVPPVLLLLLLRLLPLALLLLLLLLVTVRLLPTAPVPTVQVRIAAGTSVLPWCWCCCCCRRSPHALHDSPVDMRGQVEVPPQHTINVGRHAAPVVVVVVVVVAVVVILTRGCGGASGRVGLELGVRVVVLLLLLQLPRCRQAVRGGAGVQLLCTLRERRQAWGHEKQMGAGMGNESAQNICGEKPWVRTQQKNPCCARPRHCPMCGSTPRGNTVVISQGPSHPSPTRQQERLFVTPDALHCFLAPHVLPTRQQVLGQVRLVARVPEEAVLQQLPSGGALGGVLLQAQRHHLAHGPGGRSVR